MEFQSLLGQDVPKLQFGVDLVSIPVAAGLYFWRVVLGAVLDKNHERSMPESSKKDCEQIQK